MARVKHHIIYIVVVGRGEYAYSITIETDYQLVIELWCRYADREKYKRVIEKAVSEAVSEYIRMGLADTPFILALPKNKSIEKMVSRGFIKRFIEGDLQYEIKMIPRDSYRRGVELARHCLKNKLERYPPSRNL